MSKFKIEDDIPLKQTPSRTDYPFEEMKVGQSFFVPGAKVRSLALVCAAAGRVFGMKFQAQQRTEAEVEGVRIFRVEGVAPPRKPTVRKPKAPAVVAEAAE